MCDDELGLFVVADGVGGHAKGEVASQEAVEQIHGFVRNQAQLIRSYLSAPSRDRHPELRRLLESAVQNACYMVFGMAELDPTQRGMSTTISALLLAGGYGVTAQVGDSRIYQVREGVGAQLTEDHTLVNYQLKQGLINEREAATSARKNVITRAVGHRDYVEVDTLEIEVLPGDCYLLCSDGLHGYLQEGDLESLLCAGTEAQAPQRFIDMANERGGKDNITVITVFIDEQTRA